MRYAISVPNGGPWSDPLRLGELAHIAEEEGWDGVFIEDYLVWQGHQDVPTYDPWIALAAMALRTSRVRLGPMVTALPRRRPWKVAREAVSLDHLSNGRLILGVGLGDTSVFIRDPSLTGFGEAVDARQRAGMLDEGLEVIAGLWSGKPVKYDGEYYRVDGVAFLPLPVQSPRIPIWVGGGWPLHGPSLRAARWDGSCLYKHPAAGSKDQDITPDDVRALKAFVERHRTASTPFDICLGGERRGSDEEAERARIGSLAEAGATWWTEYFPPETGGFEVVRAGVKAGPLRVA